MYQLNRESIQIALLGNDPAAPNAVVMFADAKPVDGSSQHKVVYLVLENGDNVGQGLSNYGTNWEATLDFYTARFAPNGVAGMLTGNDFDDPDFLALFITSAEKYLDRTQNPVPTACEPVPAVDVEQSLAAGVCRTPAEFSRHVQILAKDLTHFEFKYDHLAMVAALALRISNISDDIDLVKKASLYEDESKLQGVSPLFRTAMIELFAEDDANGGGKLVHPKALARLKESVLMRDAMHMMIGIVGEAGEIAQQLHNFIVTGELPLEGKDSLPEEIGDSRFYIAGLLRVLGFTEEENNQQNYNKLKARYPAGYSNEAALNRDLSAEDKALRGN